MLFELQVVLCEKFPAFTPLSLRREKAREVFSLMARYTVYAKKHKKEVQKEQKKKIIRRPAGDDWF